VVRETKRMNVQYAFVSFLAIFCRSTARIRIEVTGNLAAILAAAQNLVRIPLRQFSATPSKFPTLLHVAARGLGPRCGPYMPRGLRAGFRLDAMIRRASRR
jgi:hypothetical protein